MAPTKKAKFPKPNEEDMADHLKSLPRRCPREKCKSYNIEFKFFNNHKNYQPRYRCLNCTEFFTLGGLRGRYKKSRIKDVEIKAGDEEETESDEEDGAAAEKCESGSRKRTMRLPNRNEAKKLKAEPIDDDGDDDGDDDDEMPEINSEDGDDYPQNSNSDEDEDEDDEDEEDDPSGRVRAQGRASRSWGRSKSAQEKSMSEEDDRLNSEEDEDDIPWGTYDEERAYHEHEDEDDEPKEEKGRDGGRGKHQVGTGTAGALKRIKLKSLYAPDAQEVYHGENVLLLDNEQRQQYLQIREAYELEEFIQHDRAFRAEMREFKGYMAYRPKWEQELAKGKRDVGRTKEALKEKALNHLDDALVACNEYHFEAHFMALDTKWKDCERRIVEENREMFESEAMKQKLRNDLREFVSVCADTSTFTRRRHDRAVAFESELRKLTDDVSEFWDKVKKCVVKKDSVHSVSHNYIERAEKEARMFTGGVLDIVRRIIC